MDNSANFAINLTEKNAQLIEMVYESVTKEKINVTVEDGHFDLHNGYFITPTTLKETTRTIGGFTDVERTIYMVEAELLVSGGYDEPDSVDDVMIEEEVSDL